MIDFASIHTSKADCMEIARIACRAEHLGLHRSRIDLIMDIEAAHHVCPLDLAGLQNAEPIDLMHDVAGIVGNLDRDTGELLNCFLPRYAMKQ